MVSRAQAFLCNTPTPPPLPSNYDESLPNLGVTKAMKVNVFFKKWENICISSDDILIFMINKI